VCFLVLVCVCGYPECAYRVCCVATRVVAKIYRPIFLLYSIPSLGNAFFQTLNMLSCYVHPVRSFYVRPLHCTPRRCRVQREGSTHTHARRSASYY